MPKLLLLSSMGPRAVPVFASVVAHAAIAVAAAGGHGGWTSHAASASGTEIAIEVEPVVPPLSVVTDTPRAEAADVHEDDDHDRHPHTHPYPVAPDHDAHPHAAAIDHRLAAPAPPPAPAAGAEPTAATRPTLLAPTGAVPTFSMALGQAAVAVGGATGGSVLGGGDAPVGATPRSASGHGAAPGASADGAFEENGVSQRARLASTLEPEYPPAARAQGVEAKVVLEIVVDERGNVAEARGAGGAARGFEESALRAIRGARFAPARRSGTPVRVRMRWVVDFRLQ
jgi:protein TonB